MKNFPSALIKQKSTKGGLGENLSSTLKNIGAKALSNILGGSDKVDLDSINANFEEGYERLDVKHEIENFNINSHYDSALNNEINEKIKKHSLSSISLNWNESNGIANAKWSNFIKFEDPFLYSSSLFNSINNYNYILKSSVPSIINHLVPNEGESNSYSFAVVQSIVAPSLFNPYQGVNFNFITEGIPLVHTSYKETPQDVKNGLDVSGLSIDRDAAAEQPLTNDTLITTNQLADGMNKNYDISDCSIRHLVELSNITSNDVRNASPLGLATYRYIDFMFCKDLGKISNNHLITLRRFGHPIGDNIFQEAIPVSNNQSIDKGMWDIGRLITWFDNEDNKLEDICKYNYNASFKEFKAQIQQLNSQQQDGDSNSLSDGFVNKIANAFSPSNNKLVAQGFSSNYGLLQWGANKLNIPIIGNQAPKQYHDWTTLGNYDQNRIYEPQNTIWDTYQYEGRLTFNQEITLVFRYKLRSYANINPKSAFLDLIGNIMTVTYKRGSFWGGESKIVGPQGNNSVYDTSNAFIDKTFDKLGGVWKMLRDGSLTPDVIKGWLGNIMESLKDALGTAGNLVSAGAKEANAMLTGENANTTADEEEAKKKASEAAKKGFDWLEKNNAQYGWTNAIKGMFKNQLGRPAIYAFNSILTGEPCGPWHLTIGNPLNPIMSMGNMILMDSQVQHMGPLGLDDFPTEIKVTVQLKHGRPRDSVEIQKMYTKGRESIYKPMNLMDVKKYFTNPAAFGDVMQSQLYGDIYSSFESFITNSGKRKEELDKKINAIISKAKNGKLTKAQQQQLAKLNKEYIDNEAELLRDCKVYNISALNKILRTI